MIKQDKKAVGLLKCKKNILLNFKKKQLLHLTYIKFWIRKKNTTLQNSKEAQ